MFGELPKLLDRDFVVGFFLPVALFLALSLGLMEAFGVPIDLKLLGEQPLIRTTLLGAVTWLLGVVLLILNRLVYRLLEGYGSLNPAQLFSRVERARYERLMAEIASDDDSYRLYQQQGEQIPDDLRTRRNQRKLLEPEQFPEEAALLLPTAFGNTLRAFERYPRVMYGFNAIEGWVRLLAVLPKEFRAMVDTAKAQTDFWVNLWFLSCVAIAEYAGWVGFAVLHDYVHPAKVLWFPFLALLSALGASWVARIAALEWGAMVKAAFDVFLPDLYQKMKFPQTATLEEEEAIWINFSKAILFRRRDLLPPKRQRAESEKIGKEAAEKKEEPEEEEEPDAEAEGDEAETDTKETVMSAIATKQDDAQIEPLVSRLR